MNLKNLNLKKMLMAGVAFKALLVVATLMLSASSTFAQKTAYVNTETIFKGIAEYKNAIASVEKFAEQAQQKIDSEYEQIEYLYNNYQRNKASMSSSERTQIENQIISKEREIKQYQESVFGNNGELMKKRIELIKPIQDKVFNAIKQIAETKQYDAVVDVASNPNIVYYSKRVDITNEVMSKLGLMRTNY